MISYIRMTEMSGFGGDVGMGYKIWDIALPILVHFLAIQCMAVIGGNRMDATWRTTMAAAVTLPLLWRWYQQERSMWKKEEKEITWYAVLGVVLGAIALNWLFSSLLSRFVISKGVSNAVQEELFAGRLWIQVSGTGILVPLAEEILFRGLVFGKLERYLPIWAAVVVGAVLFALYHGNLVQILFAFPMGIVLNLLYRHYGSLKMPVLFHAASNLGAIFLAM